MTGKELKNKLLMAGKSQKEIADLLGIKPQSLNTIYNSQDVKTGTLEKLCVVLGKNMSFFYPISDVSNTNVGQQKGQYNSAGEQHIANGVSLDTVTRLIETNAKQAAQIESLLAQLKEK